VDYCRLKDEIINFVQNAPEEANSRVAVFIAGMQAQKSLTDCRTADKCLPATAGDDPPGTQTLVP
jgi:hypothetical protein